MLSALGSSGSSWEMAEFALDPEDFGRPQKLAEFLVSLWWFNIMMERSTFLIGKTHHFNWAMASIAMLNYQRVCQKFAIENDHL